jgi:hypothetical protein
MNPIFSYNAQLFYRLALNTSAQLWFVVVVGGGGGN